MRIATTFAMTTLCLVVCGCLEREETLLVNRDGSVEITVEVSGSVGEFDGPAAEPTREDGWQIEIEDREDPDGDERKWKARKRFAPGAWPAHYAGSDPDEVALRFPTEVTIERRADGVYYHFERRYVARSWQRYQRHQDMLSKVWEEKFSDVDVAESDPATQLEAVRLLRDFELARQLEYVEAGLEEVRDEWKLDRQLGVRAAFRKVYLDVDLEQVVGFLKGDAEQEVQTFTDELYEAARDSMEEYLRNAKVKRSAIDRFFAATDREERMRSITEDLGNDSYKVNVKLPGEVIAHDGVLEGDTVTWEFLGEALMDRTQVLRATSRVRR